MNIQTKFFDEITIDENQIIEFKNGIPGLEEYKKYVVINFDENSKVKCLQSVEDKEICLIITNPFEYFNDYEIQLSDEETYELQISSQEDIAVFSVVTIKNDKVTTNLIAPIILNVIKNRGMQIILSNSKYNIRQEIACL